MDASWMMFRGILFMVSLGTLVHSQGVDPKALLEKFCLPSVDIHAVYEAPQPTIGSDPTNPSLNYLLDYKCEPGYRTNLGNTGYIKDCQDGAWSVPVEECTEDINECEEDDDICGDNAWCNNFEGGFVCKCYPGYWKNGDDCEPILCPPPVPMENTIPEWMDEDDRVTWHFCKKGFMPYKLESWCSIDGYWDSKEKCQSKCWLMEELGLCAKGDCEVTDDGIAYCECENEKGLLCLQYKLPIIAIVSLACAGLLLIVGTTCFIILCMRQGSIGRHRGDRHHYHNSNQQLFNQGFPIYGQPAQRFAIPH